MPETVEGVVTAVYEEDRGFTVYIAGKRYRAWDGVCPVARDDTARVEYETVVKEGRTYYNIVLDENKVPKITKVEIAPPAPPPEVGGLEVPGKPPREYWETRDRRISRLSIFSSLCTLYAGSGKSVEEILRYLRQVEKEIG